MAGGRHGESLVEGRRDKVDETHEAASVQRLSSELRCTRPSVRMPMAERCGREHMRVGALLPS